MTIFWLTQLQYAIIQFKSHQNTSEFPSWTDFQEVLLHTPSLINTRLWSVYYTKEHMFSTKARESWSLPDLQPLPGLLDSNYDAFSAQGKDPDRLLRYAFAVIQDTVKSGSRRGQVVKQALDSLQATTIRLRKKNTSMPPYSETQAYFWIQIVHAAIQSFNTAPDKSMNRSILDIPVSRLSSASFNALFDLNSGTWKQYYSEKVWNSIAARMAFIPPDLKPLPNVIISSSASQQNIALVKQMETSIFQRGPESPSAEYLSFRAITIIQEAVALNSPVTDSPVILTHTHMLLYLYKKLYVESQDETSRKAALEEAWSISGPPVSSVTHKTFWIQVLVAAVTRENREQTIDDCPPVGAAMCFESFIRRNSFLAYEALWSVYYSPEIWYSEEAAEMFIAPDRRKIAGSLAPGSMEKLFE
ncbi:hypothetical protein N7466_003763 [Penicillium verhagenii]|uniref:uncharacterized protein n=1 Tax=Penicillium verhagenii TaxID=1562060 RepID=UPI0025450B69|nr:uncharacterized protein N7466_003763 [Penicillium verhagenii]KAJ5934216.1 hypothetical protein N7466_003763 [Penicillium verhagenii]